MALDIVAAFSLKNTSSFFQPCIQKTQLGNGKSALDICLEWEKSE